MNLLHEKLDMTANHLPERRRVFIIGAGGHAKVLLDILAIRGVAVEGLIDNKLTDDVQSVLGCKVFHDESCLDSVKKTEVELVNGIGMVDSRTHRADVYQSFSKRGFSFASVIHPSAIIATNAALGAGCQIMAAAVVQPGCRIGENTIINTSASVDHDCTVGAHSHIAPGSVLSGFVRVGERCHIGAGATLIQNVSVGDDSVVGAGAVVIRDVPPDTVVVGVPAKPLKT